MAFRYLTVTAFGKLPFWPEYLEAGPFLPSSRGLKHWLHSGREHVGLDDPDGSRDQHIRKHVRLLLALPGSTELLVGVVKPSQDRGGRAFPFSVFVHVPRADYRKHYALLPLALSDVWDQLDDAWSSLASRATKDAFDEVQQSLQVEGPAPLADVRADYAGRRGFEVEGFIDREDGANFETLVANLPDVVARLKKAPGGPGVLLPVASDPAEACFDASVWIDLINTQFLFRRLTPSVFLDATPDVEDRNVLLKFGVPDGEDYAGAMGFSDRGLIRPAHPGRSSELDSTFDSPVPTYAELLTSRRRR